MKTFFKTVLAFYLFVLLWLVLFKFSVDIPEVFDYQARAFNIIPFAGFSDHLREMLDNFVVFVPFGLLLCVNFKQIAARQKLMCIFFFSVAVEVLQFVFAIGVADITDVIMNTLGGLFGMMLYDVTNQHATNDKRDRWIVTTCAVLLVAVILLRFMVFRVRY